MKKIVVMSDNHGDGNAPARVKELEPDADFYIHCGDSMAFSEEDLHGFLSVDGNSDWGVLDLPYSFEFEAEGLRFYVTHGHRYGMIDREKRMIEDLKDHHCRVLLSGHTHRPDFQHIGKYYLINPGSTNRPRGGSECSYAVIQVVRKKLTIDFKPFFYED